MRQDKVFIDKRTGIVLLFEDWLNWHTYYSVNKFGKIFQRKLKRKSKNEPE